MDFKLRDRILAWSITTTVVIVLAVLLLVDSSFRTTIHATLEDNLRSSARLAGELRRSHVDGWIAQVARLALDPTLRASLETADPPTIEQNLDLARSASEADWLAVVTPEGDVLAGSGPVPVARITAARSLLNETIHYDSGDLWHDDGGLVDVAASSLFFGALRLGILIGGDRIDQARANALAASTGDRVAFLAADRVTVADSTVDLQRALALPSLEWGGVGGPDAAGAEVGYLGPVREFGLDGEAFLGRALDLMGTDGEVAGRLIVFRSLDAALRPARRLRGTLLVIGIGGLLLGLLSSLALMRSVTAPLRRLLRETVRLGSGNLEEAIHPMADDEIGQLADGFDRMRISLRDARRELIRKERLSAVGQAASALVHDFTQPVTVISAHTDFLVHSWDDEQARKEEVAAIREGVRRLQAMMREVLEFARGEVRIAKASTSVATLLDDVARQTAPVIEEHGVELAVIHGYDGEWWLDYQRTLRALANLVRNAAAVAGASSGGRVELRSAREDGGLRIEVRDDGPGIPEEIRDGLFEPFVTRGKKEGTGLGLAIVKNVAESQGGSIRFETSTDGTVFIMELPQDTARAGIDVLPADAEVRA